jgi:hypothetical protein
MSGKEASKPHQWSSCTWRVVRSAARRRGPNGLPPGVPRGQLRNRRLRPRQTEAGRQSAPGSAARFESDLWVIVRETSVEVDQRVVKPGLPFRASGDEKKRLKLRDHRGAIPERLGLPEAEGTRHTGRKETPLHLGQGGAVSAGTLRVNLFTCPQPAHCHPSDRTSSKDLSLPIA